MRIRIRQALSALCIGLAPALTGCLVHHYTVPKTRPADVILNADLDQLIHQLNARYDAIQSMTATVTIDTSTGGSHQGQVTEYLTFGGYIVIGKPENIRVYLKLPVVGSIALDMVSDGKTFKMLIPPRNRAIVGSETVTKPSSNALENLRPNVFFDSLLVRGTLPDEIIVPTSDVRIIENPKKKKDLIEEPDYDIEVLTQPQGQIAHTLRVVHISRANLLPYQQDIYNPQGQVVTRAIYTDYKKFGDIDFPTHIHINRPIDQLSLTVTISAVTFNQKLDEDQFDLTIPEGVPTQHMD